MTSRRADVVVVGGGIIGLCTAWYLRKAGAHVTLLSRDPVPGRSASVGNAGMIVPSHIVPLSAPGVVGEGIRHLVDRKSPFFIKPRLDPDLWRWLWRFRNSCTESHVAYAAPVLRDQSLASIALFSELQAEIGQFSWEQTGLLMLHRSERHRKKDLKAADLAESLGLRVRRLDGPETAEKEPGLRAEVLGSVLYEDDGRVDPAACLARLRGAVSDAGVPLREGVPVRDLRPGAGGRVVVSLSDGEEFSAGTVVLAAGAWTGRLAGTLGVRIPVQPAKGYSLTFPAPGNGPSIPMILSEEKVTITPMSGRLRFAGTFALAGLDPSIDRHRVDPIRQQVALYLPNLQPRRIESHRAWSGFRPASPDGLPIVGRLRGHPNIHVATGHGMTGVTLGPVTGRLVADLLSGADPIVDPTPVDPSRF